MLLWRTPASVGEQTIYLFRIVNIIFLPHDAFADIRGKSLAVGINCPTYAPQELKWPAPSPMP